MPLQTVEDFFVDLDHRAMPRTFREVHAFGNVDPAFEIDA